MVRKVLLALLVVAAGSALAQPMSNPGRAALSRGLADSLYMNVGGDAMAAPLGLTDGTCGAPSLYRSSDATDGIMFATTYFGWAVDGVCKSLIGGSFAVASDGGFTFSSTTDPTGSSDLKLFRAGAKQLSLQGSTAGSLSLDFSVFTTARLWQFRTDVADYFVGEATVQALTNKTTISTSGNVGLGVAASGTVGTLMLGTLNGDQTTKFEVTNSEASGTSAITQLRAAADIASIASTAHGTGRVATRFGVTLGGMAEILGNGSAGKGLLLSSINTTGYVAIGAGSTLLARLDENTSLSLPPRAPTAGTMTTTASTSEAAVSITRTCRSWTNAMVAALPATAGDIAWGTLPAKVIVLNAYVVITGAAVGPTTVTVAVGRTSATYIDYIVASDAKAAANTVYGDASGERGTNLTGYDLPSYTGTTVINAHFISTGANLSTVTGSTGMVCLTLDKLP